MSNREIEQIVFSLRTKP